MISEAIKACPFCGTRPNLRETFGKLVISCDNRKCSMKPSTWLAIQSTNLRKVRAVWNQRARPTPAAQESGDE